jgi:DNA-binding response OmpR family regulator
VALIEDDPVMGQSVADWLAVEGYRTSWFRTGGEAVRALARQAPDAVICDIRLPDMSGEEVHRALALPCGQAPILFVTGHGDIAQAVRLMQAGAADYLTKPFDIEALLRRLEALLAPRWQRGDGPCSARRRDRRGGARAAPRGADRLHRAADGAERIGQGGRGAAAARRRDSARAPALRRDELRGAPGRAARERDLRP